MPLSWLTAGECFAPTSFDGDTALGPWFSPHGGFFLYVSGGQEADLIAPFQWDGGVRIEALWYDLSISFRGTVASAGSTGKGGSLGLYLSVVGNRSHASSSSQTDAKTLLDEQTGTGPVEFETWKFSHEKRFVITSEDSTSFETVDATTGETCATKSFAGYVNVFDDGFELLGQPRGNVAGDPVSRTVASYEGLRTAQDKTLVAGTGGHRIFSSNHVDQFGVDARVFGVDPSAAIKLYRIGVQWRTV